MNGTSYNFKDVISKSLCISYRSKCLQIWKTKTPGHQIARASIRFTIMFGGRCWESSVTWILSRWTSRNWSQRLIRSSGTSYHRTKSAIFNFAARCRSLIVGKSAKNISKTTSSLKVTYCIFAFLRFLMHYSFTGYSRPVTTRGGACPPAKSSCPPADFYTVAPTWG